MQPLDILPISWHKEWKSPPRNNHAQLPFHTVHVGSHGPPCGELAPDGARAKGARSHGWVASRELVSQLGAVGAPLRNLQLLSGWGRLGGDELGHRSLAEVAAAHQPLIVLLDQQAAGQADEG